MMTEDFHPSGRYEIELPACTCPFCPAIRLPGESEDLPFLRAADTVLSNHARNGEYLDITETVLLPPVLKHFGVLQAGFEAEYKVFRQLSDSNLPLFAFHSWKPLKSAEETADFLIVTRTTVISFEVKAFELFEHPAKENIERFHDVLMKSLEQQAGVRQKLGDFLRNHGCELKDDSEARLVTFTLFPMAKNADHHRSHISSDFDLKLAGNNRIDCLTASNFRERLLFFDEYLEQLQKIAKEDCFLNEQEKFQLRILLSWFYGVYSYQGVLRPGKLELSDSYKLSKDLDTAHAKIKREVAGVFLTEEQLEIVKCDQNYLAIVGLPGTGKTFCLIAKIFDVVGKKITTFQGKNEADDDLILVIHFKEKTLKYLQELILRSLSQLYTCEEMQKIENFMKFAFLEADVIEAFMKSRNRLKIFFDDYEHNCFSWAFKIRGLLSSANFFWYTCYDEICFHLNQLPRPFTQVSTDGEFIYELNKYACLNKSLRFSAEIHKVLNVLIEDMKTFKYNIEDSFWGAPVAGSEVYECGVRVVGDRVKFVELTKAMSHARNRRKLDSLHPQFNEMKTCLTQAVLEEVSRLKGLFSLKDIIILNISEPVLIQDLCKEGSELEVTNYRHVRGREKECVIIFKNSMDDDDSQKLLDAVTRAISKVVILYSPEDLKFKEIVQRVQTISPELSSSAIRKRNRVHSKSTTDIFKEYESKRLHDLLVEKDHYGDFWDFVVSLHLFRRPCFPEEAKRKGLVAYCSLSCANECLQMVQGGSNSEMFRRFQIVCHYALVLMEIRECCLMLRECETEFVQSVSARIQHCLNLFFSWIKEETDARQGVFDSSFLLYKRLFDEFLTNLKGYCLKDIDGRHRIWMASDDIGRHRIPNMYEIESLVSGIETLIGTVERTSGLIFSRRSSKKIL